MGLEKEIMHVVIKLPFKRPSDFVEPPPVVWTDEMEHQLWKYMNQKHTDWNYIAQQLGVPTPYLVRHAAFMYETQLRGIQQQLRLSEAGRPTTVSSSSPPPVVSTSTSSSNMYRPSRPTSQRQVRPVSSSSTSSRTQQQQQQQQQQQNSTLWKNEQEQQVDDFATTSTAATSATPQLMTAATEAMVGSSTTISIHNSPYSRSGYDQSSTATHRSIISSNMDIGTKAMATASVDRYQHSPHDDSMMLSTISNISPRNESNSNLNDADLIPLSPYDDNNSKYTSNQYHHQHQHQEQKNAVYQPPGVLMTSHIISRKNTDHGSGDLDTKYYGSKEHQREMNDMDHTEIDRDKMSNDNNRSISSSNNNDDDGDDDNDDDDGLSTHLENMKLQSGEPAFLPSRRTEGSQLLSSLRASYHQSKAALSNPAFSTTSSTKFPSPPSSQRYSPITTATTAIIPSSSSASVSLPTTSEQQQQQQRSQLSKNTPPSTTSEKEPMQDMDGHQTLQEDYSIENKPPISNDDDASDTSSNGKAKMIFGPNLNRTATTQPSDESNKDGNSALNSVGSSFSDLSDYSVTQSAMEDAFLSKLNNGSKMSSLAFSRKYT